MSAAGCLNSDMIVTVRSLHQSAVNGNLYMEGESMCYKPYSLSPTVLYRLTLLHSVMHLHKMGHCFQNRHSCMSSGSISASFRKMTV